MEQQPFSCRLTSAPAYTLAEPTLVTFTIENRGDTAVRFLVWGTPLEGTVTDCLDISCDGRPVEYDGRLVKRGDPTADQYVTIAPGESLTETVDISLAYPIDRPGEYTVALDTRLFDAFTVTGPAPRALRLRDELEPHRLSSPDITFTVVPGGEPTLTSGQSARKVEQARWSRAATTEPQAKSRAPAFNGGTDAERAEVTLAHDNAGYFTALALVQLQTTDPGTNALYDEWFGAYDGDRFTTVTTHFTDIDRVLRTEEITYDLTGEGCQPSYFAYTHKGGRTIWLCAQFWAASQIGIDSKFGTLVHELSHAVSFTDDHVYGQSAARNLANTDPAQAITNADNHEYFVEELAQSDFGKSCVFITDRSTFGRDEIDAMLAAAAPAVIDNAFYVHVDGYWPRELGITAASLSGPPVPKPTLTVVPAVPGMTVTATALRAQDSTLPEAPQRFTWVYQVSFANLDGFPADPGDTDVITLTAGIADVTGTAQIQLIREPNPYEIDGETSWLSTDLRVFQIRAGDSRFGETMGPSPDDASDFVIRVVSNFNTGNSGGETFDSISTDQETSRLELAEQSGGVRVFNFAVAKVRYRGTVDLAGVRTFFRLFPASTTSLDYNQDTTYRRFTEGDKVIPLLGLSPADDVLSIPCFASPRIDSSVQPITDQTDGLNVRVIPRSVGGQESVAYFGCWLDINQNQPQFPLNPSPRDGGWPSGRLSIQQLIRNAHQCLVAEIAYDNAPIPPGLSPAVSDKLAQRNLSIVESANPGDPASRRIPNTFEIRMTGTEPQQSGRGPDELLIDWGDTPPGSTATLYIPEIDVGRIVDLADELYGRQPVVRVDQHTLRLPVGDLTYLPLPSEITFDLTALLTVDLPATVRRGDAYTVVVRQATDTSGVAIGGPGNGNGPGDGPGEGPGEGPGDGPGGPRPQEEDDGCNGECPPEWRGIVGSYQLTIPVRTKETMLPDEIRLLSVLKWIHLTVPAEDRWYPAFSRYVQVIADRVRGLGGDPDQVRPSPAGDGGVTPGDGRLAFEGKISGLVYDCFGDFEAFLLDECGEEHRFLSREPEIEALIRRAWRERVFLTVYTTEDDTDRPVSIVLRHAPRPQPVTV
ncbi:M35 family metallo-endopeptidase [Streptomyces jumonjinensis]|uniref:Lysine-specific metallo-endopeptidase domain-containing protein n=1 Tax=Streptomyces jumonjinensis TaxID=1945 RepID=A0A646KP92_STRJU|nr:M35 family metallo-endopeptidase [Streptomyces jumonjinensis]MQT03711.1 hypothetical protein [Streptomyces jumonjinensis]